MPPGDLRLATAEVPRDERLASEPERPDGAQLLGAAAGGEVAGDDGVDRQGFGARPMDESEQADNEGQQRAAHEHLQAPAF